MSVLIIGGTSSVGQAIAKHLVGSHHVLTTGRSEGDYLLDLSVPGASVTVAEVLDVIVYCAADFGGLGIDDMIRAETVNALGVLSAIRIAKQSGCRHLVMISSVSAGYTYGNHYYNSYAVSKKHGEDLAQLYCGQLGIMLTILRPAQVYGPTFAFAKRQPLFYALMRHAQRGEDVTLYGSVDAGRQFIHVDDLAAIVKGVIELRIEGQHNVTDERVYALTEVVKLAYSAFGTSGAIRFDETRQDIPDIEPVKHSATLLAKDLCARISLESGIKTLASNEGAF